MMELSPEAKSIIKEMLVSGELRELPNGEGMYDRNRLSTWMWESGTTHDLFYLSYWEDEGWDALSSNIYTEEGHATAEDALEEYRQLARKRLG